MEILLLWPALCFLVAWVAGQKGRSAVGFFFLSLFLSPLIGFLVVLAVPRIERTVPPRRGSDYVLCHGCNRPRRADAFTCPHCGAGATPAPATKKCPACAEQILAEAVKCRYCGTDLPAASTAPAPQRPASAMGTCPGCRKLRGTNQIKCIYCGNSETPV